MAQASPLAARKKQGLTEADIAARSNLIEQIGLLQARMRDAGEMPLGPNSVLHYDRSKLMTMSPKAVQSLRDRIRQHIIKFKTKMRDY